jgi:hypothetical protein
MSTISLSLRLWHRARDVCASAMPMPHPLTAVATFHLAAARENHITAAAELRALASALGDGNMHSLPSFSWCVCMR